jgi:hypothetical protein
MTIKEKFINTINQLVLNPTEKCVLYEITNKDGYGSIQYKKENGKKKQYLAHRLAYEVCNKINLTSEQLILHSCDIPNCVNPKHLRIGTHQDNSNDRVIRNRQAKGKTNGRYTTGYNSKYASTEKPKAAFETLFGRNLTEEQVITLKEAIKNKGTKSLKKLSEEIGVKYQTLRDLNIGRIYKNPST